ncbi:4-hydroxy-tetrahydrodipicolinate synthase [Rugosimonospora acidiphila]|uniref:4-hydroxy-tetrahydrodipicolinate synthase n=1 Tax=Rugosimonospora acidiphila TaxID=556531 RepID=A0ABP9SK76_9ACTN
MANPADVTVALLTPVDEQGRVDHVSLERLVKRTLAGGVTGISPLGSTGEGYSLPLSERLAATDTVVRTVPDGTPVICGVFAHSHEQAIDEIAAYAERGATGALLAPPSYYPLNAAEQRDYLTRVADGSALPLIFYNIPAFTKVSLATAVLTELAAHPRVVGVKDSCKDFGYLTSLLDALAAAGVPAERFGVFTGTDAMLVASLIAGARGTICASANLVPELPAGIAAAIAAGDLDEARRIETRLRRIVTACRLGGTPTGMKAAVAAAGICDPWMVSPRRPLGDADRATLVASLTDLGVLS